MQQLYEWLNPHHLTVPSSYPLLRPSITALSSYRDGSNLPIDNNWAENQMRLGA